MMKNKNKKDEKKCWGCKRTLIGESKLGLCPKCINKYGTPVVAAGVVGIGVLGKTVVKNSGKIAKSAVNVIKQIK